MFFNRTEISRHSFGHPPEVAIWLDNKKEAAVYGLILDISQRGARIFSEKELLEGPNHFQFSFIVYQETIRTEAVLAWKKPHAGGWAYGFEFLKDPIREMLIAKELSSLKEPI